MGKIELDISEKLKTEIDGKTALNVVKLSLTKGYPFFFTGRATTNFSENKIEVPYEVRNLILSNDSTSPNDKLYFTFDPNIINGYLLNDETLEINDVKPFTIIYLKSTSGTADYRLWLW